MSTTPPLPPSGDDPTLPNPPLLILDRYRVDATLGHGGFGDVVRAYDTRIRRTVAIKTLRPAVAVQYPGEFMGLRERFEREAEASSRMGVHPHVIAVYDFAAATDGTLYLIMEYAPGGTLAPRIEHGPLPLHEALRLTADAALGLHAAHQQGIVHRDVKPANLFLTAEGRAKVGDFGIAQIDDLSQRSRMAVHHPGTPLYMSPEQERETGYLRALSDEYSLGLVLYELVTGRKYKALEPREAAGLLAWHGGMVAPVVARMIAERREERYPTLGAVAEELEAILLTLGANRGEATVVDPAPAFVPQPWQEEQRAAPPPEYRPPPYESQPPVWSDPGTPSVAPVQPIEPSPWYPPPPSLKAGGGKLALVITSLPLALVIMLRLAHRLDTFSAAFIMAPYLVTLLFLLLMSAAPAPDSEGRIVLFALGLAPILLGVAVTFATGAHVNQGLLFIAPTGIATVALLIALVTVLPGGTRSIGWGIGIGLLATLAIVADALAWRSALGDAHPAGSPVTIVLQFLLIIVICLIPEILVAIVAAVQRRRSRRAEPALAREVRRA